MSRPLRHGVANALAARYVTGMAPLSNAERQARFRRNLRQRASQDGLAEQARKAVDRAIEGLWAFNLRQRDAGNRFGDFDGCESVEQLRTRLAHDPADLVGYCRSFTEADGLTDEEAAFCRVVAEGYDALTLASERPAKRARKG